MNTSDDPPYGSLTCCRDWPNRFTKCKEYEIYNTDEDFYYFIDDNGDEYKLPKKTTEGHEYFVPTKAWKHRLDTLLNKSSMINKEIRSDYVEYIRWESNRQLVGFAYQEEENRKLQRNILNHKINSQDLNLIDTEIRIDEKGTLY